MTKKLRQKIKYLENEKSFQDEIKSIFHHFWRAFIQTNKTIFLREWESDFKFKYANKVAKCIYMAGVLLIDPN